MALAATVTNVNMNRNRIIVSGTLTASGSYPTGGDTVNLNSATWPVGSSGAVPSQAAVGAGESYVQGTSGYTFGVIPGTSPADTKVLINSAAGTEVSAGAYPAAITGDTNFRFCFSFQKLV